MRDDLKRAVELVRGGLTYREAGEAYGLSYYAISSACGRAGIRVGSRPRKISEAGLQNIRKGAEKRRGNPQWHESIRRGIRLAKERRWLEKALAREEAAATGTGG